MIARLLVGLLVVAGAALGTLAYRLRGPRAAASEGRQLEALPEDLAGPAVLVFTATLCVACRRTPGLVAEALDVEEARLRAGEAPLGFAEVDVAEAPRLVEELDVASTPTLVGIDGRQRVAFVHEGNPAADELATDLAALREG